MPRKKLQSTASRPRKVVNNEILDLSKLPSKKIIVNLPEHSGSLRTLNFAKHYGSRCDDVVHAAQRVLENMTKACISSNGKILSASTIANYYSIGLAVFIPYCTMMASALGRDLRLNDIDRKFINYFIAHIRLSGGALSSQVNQYKQVKSVLVAMAKSGWIEKDLFPRNPFPNSNRSMKGQIGLSEAERRSVLKALKYDMRAIIKGNGTLSADELTTCLLAIASRTGINPTPAIELLTDCLQPHPIKQDRYVLISLKRRGSSTHIQNQRRTADVESMVSALPDVALIINLILERNAELRQVSNYPELLFVFKSRGSKNVGEIRRLTLTVLGSGINKFLARHQITDADGKPLKLNVMRLRKTFENRLFTLSGQDPFLTAKLGGHTLKISDTHYLEAPEIAQKDWRLMGEIRTEELLNHGKAAPLPTNNTPVARCRDTLNGEYALKNGEHCQKFLACFRCSSFVVTGDDLYRVFSLYWALIRMRQKMGASAWKKFYGHIVRIIDQEIAPKFNAELVSIQRQRAKFDPHPFWRNTDLLENIV